MVKWIWAINCCLGSKVAKRVVVKRPRLAVFLNDQTRSQWLGDACRFDAYFQLDHQT
jgi:16S rRNA (guanine1516-N2)-methyltransferase